jgi:hypothetical protein
VKPKPGIVAFLSLGVATFGALSGMFFYGCKNDFEAAMGGFEGSLAIALAVTVGILMARQEEDDE